VEASISSREWGVSRKKPVVSRKKLTVGKSYEMKEEIENVVVNLSLS